MVQIEKFIFHLNIEKVFSKECLKIHLYDLFMSNKVIFLLLKKSSEPAVGVKTFFMSSMKTNCILNKNFISKISFKISHYMIHAFSLALFQNT